MVCTRLPSDRETTRPAPLTFGIGSVSRQPTAILIRASAVMLTDTVSSIVIGSTGPRHGCRPLHDDIDFSEMLSNRDRWRWKTFHIPSRIIALNASSL